MEQKTYRLRTLPLTWAILPSELDRVRASIHDVGSERINAFFENPNVSKREKTFRMDGNIAILSIEGIIQPKRDIWSWLFGGAVLEDLTADLKSLLNDNNVEAVILDIDSPGGVVHGIQEFANLVFAGRKIKPVYAVSSSVMASAAYWIGSASEKVFITDESVMTGSIGVVVSHIDISELEKKLGIKTTEITAGKRKRVVSSHAPLTEEGRTELQRQVDHIYGAFTGDVAKFRNVPVATVVSAMADGQIFLGSQGVRAGLVDKIKTSDAILAEISELARTRSIDAISIHGHEALIDAARADGISTAETLAVEILSAIREKRQGEKVLKLKRNTESATVNILPEIKHHKGDVRMEEQGVCRNEKGEFVGASLEALKAEWESSAGLRTEFKHNFAAFRAYEENKHKSKIYSAKR